MKCVKGYELKVLKSAAGFYIGTEAPVDERFPESLFPYCRFSDYMSEKQAQEVLKKKKLLLQHDRFGQEQSWCSGGVLCLDYDEYDA